MASGSSDGDDPSVFAPIAIGGSQGLTISASTRHLVGVINLSNTSRIKHTVVADSGGALRRADEYRRAGVRIVDIGAQSSRFDSPVVSLDDELQRLIPAVVALVEDGHLVCVETWRPRVAREAIAAGAVLLNATAQLTSVDMTSVLVEAQTPCVVTYVDGPSPREVQGYSEEENKPEIVFEELDRQARSLASLGIVKTIVDPGLGISYRSDYEAYTRQQIKILRDLPRLRQQGRPVLVAVPRKDDLHRVIALATLTLENGANLVRIHDIEVAEISRFLGLID